MPESTAGESTRSEATRAQLLDAGLVLFSRRGFDGVSTRALATAAGVNQAAIPYHFQSKEGLYHAVAHRIVDMLRVEVQPVIDEVRQRHGSGVTDLRTAREDVIALVLVLLEEILSQPDHREIGNFIVREQMQPTPAMDILYDGLMHPMHQLLGTLVAALRGKAEDDPDLIIEVQALYGEAIVFGVHRTTLIRRLGVVALDGYVDRITGVVRNLVERQFPL